MSELYTVSMVLRQAGSSVALNYRSLTRAQADHAVVTALLKAVGEDTSPVAVVADDFGNVVAVDATDVMAVVLQDLGRALEAQTESSLMQAHAQSKAQRRAAADPMLRVQPGNGMVINH